MTSPRSRLTNRRTSGRRPPKPGVKVACYATKDSNGPNLALALLDASQIGVRLLLSESVAKGEEVALSLEGPSGEVMARLGVVIWSVRDPGGYRLGIHLRHRLTFEELAELTYFRF